MSLTTSKGIVYPESTDHTRLWEWFQTMGTGADGIIIGGVDVQVLTASGTWTKPAGAIITIAEVQGAGGGSGGLTATATAGCGCGSGGGGGGEYARGTFKSATLGATETVTVGVGGLAGATGGGNGGVGGTSSFGAWITAVGGNGGFGSGASGANASLYASNGGNGGSGGTGGDVRVQGSDGGCGIVILGYVPKENNGGRSFLGGEQRPATNYQGTSGGTVGKLYGGGAAGGSYSNFAGSASIGSVGAAGVVIVTTYTS